MNNLDKIIKSVLLKYYFKRKDKKMKNENKSVWSQEKEAQEEISELVEENSSKEKEAVSEEDLLEIVEENSSETEEAVSEVAEEVAEVEAVAEAEEIEEDVISQVKNLKKNDAAKLLVEKANIIVNESEAQMEACNLLLSDDLKGYETAKKALNEDGLNACETLLSELGYIDNDEETAVEDGVVFEPKEDLPPIGLKDVSSGKFSSFLLALIGGAVTLGGMAYVATEKLGVTLDLSKMTTPETLKPVFDWYGKLVGFDANTGMALVAVVTLLVMWIIYTIRVSSKGSKNLNFAMQQLEEAEVYCAHKSNCKEEMDKVDIHIHDAIATLKTYQVLFNEQKGKLQRILHIEGEKEEFSEYHQKSIVEMKETQGLISSIRSFMATAMSEDGKLSGKSTLFLHSAKSKMQKMIEGLY